MISVSEIVEYLSGRNIDFCDARYEEKNTLSITVMNDEIRAISSIKHTGISIRVYMNGSWGYASTTSKDWNEIKEAADRAYRMAKKLSGDKVSRKEFTIIVSTEEAKPRITHHPWDVPIDDKLDVLFSLNKIERDIDSRVVNTVSRYSENIDHYELANSIGSLLVWDEIRTRLSSFVIAAEAGKMQRSYFVKDGTVGFELVRKMNLEEEAKKVVSEAVGLLNAKKPPMGEITVIADPSVAGGLAHEVMGHASEADEVIKKRSFLTGVIGQKVGTELITMVDDGTVPGAHGSVPFDSEGVPSSRTVIIQNGIYKGYMHNLETASIMDTEPTGNGRAQDFNRRIFVRMTNTFFEPGDWKFEEMIEDTKDGLLALKSIGGMEDPVGGGFQTDVLLGYIIKDGELKDMVRSFSVSGKALEILKTVDAVSKEFELHGGFCGKGEEDFVPVSTGGPYMRGKMLVGGG